MTVEERLERVETLYMAIARHLGIDADAQVHADDDAYERAIQALAAGDRRPTIGEPEAGRAPAPEPKAEEELLRSETPAPLLELRELLRKNPGVRIINTPERFTVLRDGKYVGGRINRLVFHEPLVRDYLLAHPAGEIGWENLIP